MELRAPTAEELAGLRALAQKVKEAVAGMEEADGAFPKGAVSLRHIRTSFLRIMEYLEADMAWLKEVRRLCDSGCDINFTLESRFCSSSAMPIQRCCR